VSVARARWKQAAYAVVATLITGAAAWVAYRTTHVPLGVFGGVLAAIAATLLVGAPFAVVAAVMWGPQDPAPPRRAASNRRAEEEVRPSAGTTIRP